MSDPTANTGAPAPAAPGTANTDPPPAPAANAPAPAEPKVPESYEFKMPDGVQLDKAAADEFTAIAKELKLDQANAQRVADIGAKLMQRQVEARNELINSWTEQTKSDPDIGGDKLDANLGIARKAIDAFGGDALREVLNQTGLGNHPALVKAFIAIGKKISEDTPTPSASGTPAKDPASILFPDMKGTT